MNIRALLQPYAENNRTIEGQFSWLQKKGIPGGVIEKIMMEVYDEIDRGAKYADGHELDRAILARCQEQVTADAAEQWGKLETWLNSLRGKWDADLRTLAASMDTVIPPESAPSEPTPSAAPVKQPRAKDGRFTKALHSFFAMPVWAKAKAVLMTEIL